MLKRLFDFSASLVGVFFFSPLFVFASIFILLDSPGEILFRQKRVGKNGKLFNLYKFRTMKVGSESKGQLTIGEKDQRITKAGCFLRKYKIDEFPQLFNVLKGDMSIVGPRPEVQKYVDLYTEEQKKILELKPGITDYASIEFSDENEMLSTMDDPEKGYIEKIVPKKIALNMRYREEMGLLTDVMIVFKTLGKILGISSKKSA